MLAKVAEYLGAGVSQVCVLDLQREAVTVYSPDQPAQTLTGDEELTLPDLFPGFQAPIRLFVA